MQRYVHVCWTGGIFLAVNFRVVPPIGVRMLGGHDRYGAGCFRPQDELLGSVEGLVRNLQTDKIDYLVVAPDENFGIDGKHIPVP